MKMERYVATGEEILPSMKTKVFEGALFVLIVAMMVFAIVNSERIYDALAKKEQVALCPPAEQILPQGDGVALGQGVLLCQR